MPKRLMIGVVGISFAIAMMAFLCNPGTISAQECRVIRIIGMATHNSIRVEPETLTVSKGDCVVWFNRESGPNLQIVFEEGKACAAATADPTGAFKMGYGTCFVSSFIPFAGTSSLRFQQKGSYKYTVESVTGDKPEVRGTKVTTGTILVE